MVMPVVHRSSRRRGHVVGQGFLAVLGLVVILVTRMQGARSPVFMGARPTQWKLAGAQRARGAHVRSSVVRLKSLDSDDIEKRREFGNQVSRDVAVWMVLAFATSGTDFAPYVLYAGAASVAFAVCYQVYCAQQRGSS